ncbi:hypothetical protein G810_01268 [Escherichia coli HVH 152 (4-3447545)]|nr:hypothetical protein G810_01268 [Escherichia coli HVH 152 (4-3447545)]
MIKSKIVLLSALVSCALISGCKEENKTNVSIEFMHSSVEQERQAVGNDSNLLIVFYVQIMPDDFVMQLHRF